MLWKLLSRIDRSCFSPSVIALSTGADYMLQSFMTLGIPCELIGMTPGISAVGRVVRLASAIRNLSPDIVQGWMYHGNIAATLAAGIVRPRVPIMWNIRASLIEPSQRKPLTAFIIWAGGKLSASPARIINNSIVSAVEHERRFGYRSSKRVILPNGFDTEAFRPSMDARLGLRRSLDLSPDAFLVGRIGRYHPVKDHGNFLRAASILRDRHPQVHYVLAGEHIDDANTELSRMIGECDLRGHVHLLGRRMDMERVMAALDACTSSSSSEAFPNVIGEAMSCAVPCVVTDVGDSASIVGEAGRAVPPRDPQALAQALASLIEMDAAQRAELGLRARQRIIDHFSLDKVVRQYEDLYVSVHDEFSRQKTG